MSACLVMPHQRRLNPGQEVRKNLELLLCEVEERLAHHGDEILPRGSTKSRQVGPVPALGGDVVGSLHNEQGFDDCRRAGINQEREREPLSSQANSDPVKHHHILTAGEALEHVAEMAHLGVRVGWNDPPVLPHPQFESMAVLAQEGWQPVVGFRSHLSARLLSIPVVRKIRNSTVDSAVRELASLSISRPRPPGSAAQLLEHLESRE